MQAGCPCPLTADDDTIKGEMTGLEITKARVDDSWISLAVSGEIDLATVDQLEKEVKATLDSDSGNLVIDLSSAGFMDSTGLRALVMADRSFRDSGRKFALVITNGPISRLIELSGVESTVTVVSSTAELVGSELG
jgi:anti-sigma B factor antagonist